MDEVRLITALCPEPPEEADKICRAARARLAAAYLAPQGHARRPAPWRATVGRSRLVTVALGGGAVLAAVSLAVVLISTLPTSHRRAAAARPPGRIATAAWTVRVNPGRTVTVTILLGRLRDPRGLERALRREGIPAIVRYTPTVTENVAGHPVTGPACQYAIQPAERLDPAIARTVIVPPPRAVHAVRPVARHVPLSRTPLATFTIRPRAMPTGAAVFIQVQADQGASAIELSLLARGRIPPCVPLRQWLQRHQR